MKIKVEKKFVPGMGLGWGCWLGVGVGVFSKFKDRFKSFNLLVDVRKSILCQGLSYQGGGYIF